VTITLCRAGRSGKPQHPFDRRASGDCNVHRAALAAGERTAGGAGRAGAETPRCVWHGELRAAVTASCAPSSVFVFTSMPSPPRGCYSWPYGRRKGGDRQGRQARFAVINPGDAFPPAAYQDNGTQCQKQQKQLKPQVYQP
jgi:hypothetical protein